MPKLPARKPLFIIFFFLIFIVLVVFGYNYLQVRKPVRPPIKVSPEAMKKAKKGREEYEEVKKEIEVGKEELKKEEPPLTEACLYLPPAVDPMIGIYRLDRPGENLVDYFYEGKVVSLSEKKYKDCDYIYLTLSPILKGGNNFDLIFPSGLLSKTDLGEVSVLLYREHLGERVKIQIRFREEERLKMVDWWPLVFVVE